jgi:hypothetical protein
MASSRRARRAKLRVGKVWRLCDKDIRVIAALLGGILAVVKREF